MNITGRYAANGVTALHTQR